MTLRLAIHLGIRDGAQSKGLMRNQWTSVAGKKSYLHHFRVPSIAIGITSILPPLLALEKKKNRKKGFPSSLSSPVPLLLPISTVCKAHYSPSLKCKFYLYDFTSFSRQRRNSLSPLHCLRRELLQGAHKLHLFQLPEAELAALTVCAVQVQRSAVAFLPGWHKVQDESNSPTFQLIIVAQQDICNYTHFAAVAPFQYMHESFQWLLPCFVPARVQQEKTRPFQELHFHSSASPAQDLQD